MAVTVLVCLNLNECAKMSTWCTCPLPPSLGAALTASFARRQGEVYACCNLGVLYYRQRQYDEALTYCERFFEAARGLNDQRVLDVARVNLGAVRAALTFRDYVQVCW